MQAKFRTKCGKLKAVVCLNALDINSSTFELLICFAQKVSRRVGALFFFSQPANMYCSPTIEYPGNCWIFLDLVSY